jgi:hypothetical protein
MQVLLHGHCQTYTAHHCNHILVLNAPLMSPGMYHSCRLFSCCCTCRHGKSSFMAIAQHMLPLNEPSDPYLTASLGAMQPAGVLQALLLHWLLLPQLAFAGLPALPEKLLMQLLRDVVAVLSSRQLQMAARWSEVWRLTQLQQPAVRSTDGAAAMPGLSAGAAAAGLVVHEPMFDSSVASNAWCGFAGISVSHIAHVFSCAADALLPMLPEENSSNSGQQQQQRQLSQGAAAAAGQLRAVAKALLLGLEPMQPMLLLVLQQLLLASPVTASATSGSSSSSASALPAQRQLQLLQILLEAGSSSPLQVMSLAELVDSSFSTVFKPSSSNSSEWGDAAGIESQHILLRAAVDVLAALPADQLQQELQQLLDLQASRYSSSSSSQPFSHAVYMLCLSLAERAEPAQAVALLAALPMPAWAAVWAKFVSPTAGAFCWTRRQLAAVLAGVTAADLLPKVEGTLWGTRTAAASSVTASSGSGWQKLEAAWAVVCAHFALGEVRQELQRRVEARAASSSSSSYVQGAPFIGDGWEQAGSTTANSAAAAAGVTSFDGSLGAFVDEVLQLLAPPTAACHVAALVEVMPVDAFARLAAQLLPATAFDAASAAAGDAASAAPSIPGLQKSLLKLYSSVAQQPDAATAVQLLAAAALQLPIDRLPAFLKAAWEVCGGLQRMPWLSGAAGPGTFGVGAAASVGGGTGADSRVKDVRYSTGYAWNNAWPMSSSSSSGGGGGGDGDGSTALGAQEHFELIVAAAAAGKDSAALQQMLAVLVRQLPVDQAQLALDVLGGGVSDAAFAAATDSLQQRKKHAAATGPMADAFAGQVVWQMGQSDAAAADDTTNAAAAAAAVAKWGAEKDQDDSAAAAAAAAGFAADQVLVREVVQLVDAIPAAVPAGSLAMDAMQVRSQMQFNKHKISAK